MKKSSSPKNVLIVGAGEAGEMLLREINRQPDLKRKVVGFADDDPDKKKIGEVNVLGKTTEIDRLIQDCDIDEVIIAIPSASGEFIRRVTSQADRLNAELRIVPGVREIIEGEVSWHQIRDLEVEDLLGREVVEVDERQIAGFLEGKTVLVTGGAGSIGSQLVKKVLENPLKLVVALDNNESALYELEMTCTNSDCSEKLIPVLADVRDRLRIEQIIHEYRPDLILHAAAFKHVPMLEKFPAESIKTNIGGTINVFRAAAQSGVDRCLLISTDKAVEPCNTMGMSKRIGEYLVGTYQAENNTTIYSAVRFGNVLASRGSVVPLFKKQIEQGGPVTVTDPEVVRYFMTISEAVKLVLTAATYRQPGKIYVLDLGEQVSILDLARQLIVLAGYQPEEEIEIVFSGLREGEKLEEKLFAAVESAGRTDHPLIRKITAPALDSRRRTAVAGLIKMAQKEAAGLQEALLEILNQ
ncbi:MAG: SDR family NAD(P)-dependent oxidoreductase [bacterium]